MAKKLLIVDSDPAVQALVKTALSGAPFEVTFLHDGLSALDLLSKVDPDLILADYHLEGIDINRFCEKIKQKSSKRNRPVILMVGASDSYDPKSFFEKGVVDFLKKPLQPETLLEKLRNLSEDSATIVDRPGPSPPTSAQGTTPADESSKIEQLLGWSLPSDSTGDTLTQKVAAGELGGEDNESTTIVMRPPPPPAQETKKETPAKPSSPPTTKEALEAQFPQLYGNPGVPDVGTSSTSPQSDSPQGEINAAAREIIEKVAWEVIPGLAEAHYKAGGSGGSSPGTGNPAPGGAVTTEGLTPEISKMAREIIEKVAWEVVPQLAEIMIRDELHNLKPGQPS